MENAILDPETGQPLPEDAIVRVLHITSRIHVYTLPPNAIATTRGYQAASWTADPRNPIFTGRLRVLETSFSLPASQPTPESQQEQQQQQQQPPPQQQSGDDTSQQHLKITILLEDPATGALFAACPYDHPRAVQPTADSSRFFALRVRDPSGKQRATLGVGFEDRAEAFDFGVALQEAGRGLAAVGVAGFSSSSATAAAAAATTTAAAAAAAAVAGGEGPAGFEPGSAGAGKDWSLKEGETITVKLSGTRFGRRAASGSSDGASSGAGDKETAGQSLSAFALPPPPPPPSSARSAREERAQKRLSAQAQQLGFDDGQFGEFA
ncbi:hypothetical protein VTJ83DRAFT_4712 [Remersonia thermophila]|uniref:NECAP PHear domain-containing protein n=1 Tax=Remersonia thermophila TaxID=72144 RepID=A0ABR4DBH3_9PEZI